MPLQPPANKPARFPSAPLLVEAHVAAESTEAPVASGFFSNGWMCTFFVINPGEVLNTIYQAQNSNMVGSFDHKVVFLWMGVTTAVNERDNHPLYARII